MLLLIIVALVVLLVTSAVGLAVLRAGRQLDDSAADQHGAPVAPAGTVAARVDASLERARAAVEDAVLPEPHLREASPSPAAHRDRAWTYTLVGGLLLGLGAALLIGVLLLV